MLSSPKHVKNRMPGTGSVTVARRRVIYALTADDPWISPWLDPRLGARSAATILLESAMIVVSRPLLVRPASLAPLG
jgi:hypothetical protein